MSILSSLKITNWNEHDTNQADLNKPELVDYFTASYDRSKLSYDFNYLKYLDVKAEFNVSKMKSKFTHSPTSKIFGMSEGLLPIKQWVKDNSSKNYIEGVEIVTYPAVLSAIMCTPFEICGEKRKWKFEATFNHNKIFLIPKFYYETIPNSNVRCNYCSCTYNMFSETKSQHCYVCHMTHDIICKNKIKYNESKKFKLELQDEYEFLKRYLFVRKPEELYRKVTSFSDTLFYEVYHLNTGTNKVLYLSETPGVRSESKLTTIEELKQAKHVYSEVLKLEELTKHFINYNPATWSRAQLINADECIIGLYDVDNKDFKDIVNFKVDIFDETSKYANLWSRRAAWYFLDEVLTFIKDEVFQIDPVERSKFMWQFESFMDNKPFVTMERSPLK